MATFVFTDAYVTVGGTNLSDHVRSVTLNVTADQQDNTAMGATFRSRQGGLKDWTVSLEFNQDFSAGSVEATLWPLLGTSPAIVVRPTSAAKSATNPEYSGPALVSQVNPVSSGVGDLATQSVTWQGAGALARATA